MPNLVHLSAHIITPLIAVDGVPAINIGVSDSTHRACWQAIHNMVCQLGRRHSTEILVESSRNGILHDAVALRSRHVNPDSGDSIADTSFSTVVSTDPSPGGCLLEVELAVRTRCVLCGDVDRIPEHKSGESTLLGSSFSIIRDDSNHKNRLVACHSSEIASHIFFLVVSDDDVGKETGMSCWDETFIWSTREGLNELASRYLGLATRELPTFQFLFPKSRFSAGNRNDGSVGTFTCWAEFVSTIFVVGSLD
jgi:hypothetical protein